MDSVAVDNPHATLRTFFVAMTLMSLLVGTPTYPAEVSCLEYDLTAHAQRTKAALAAAKARGRKLGGPKLALATKLGNAANAANADRFAANVAPIILQVQKSGATSLRAVAAALTARGIPTARGGEWNAAQVANVLKRVEA